MSINYKTMPQSKVRIEVASDVSTRDGIGIEVYRDDKLIFEIFRDDTARTRTVTVYENEIALDILEEAISLFKKEIPSGFIDYSKIK